jgi:K+-sensing histidine kinase KdpD
LTRSNPWNWKLEQRNTTLDLIENTIQDVEALRETERLIARFTELAQSQRLALQERVGQLHELLGPSAVAELPAVDSVAANGTPKPSQRPMPTLACCVVLLAVLTVAASLMHASAGTAGLLFLSVIAVSAMLGGFLAWGFLAPAAALLLTWFFTHPLYSLYVDNPRDIRQINGFLTVAFLIGLPVLWPHLRSLTASFLPTTECGESV